MPVSYACRCSNVRLQAAQAAARYASVDLIPTFTLADMVKYDGGLLQCLICGQIIHKPAEDDKVEMTTDVSSDQQPPSSAVLPLDLSALDVSPPDAFPSAPRPPTSPPVASVSTLLPPLPDPLFLPPPFTPSHSHFLSVSALAFTRLKDRREHLEQEIAVYVSQKRAELTQAEKDVRREVMVVWEAYKAHASPSKPSTPTASRSGSRQPEAVPRNTGFSAGSRGSLDIERQAESKSSSPGSINIGIPQTAAFVKVQTPTGSPPTAGQSSLLSASLARRSHFPQHLQSPTSSSHTPASSARSPLSPVPSQSVNGSISSASASIPTKANGKGPAQDLDLATSMRFSHLPSPPNLIFSTTNSRAGATLVREGDEVRSKSWEDRAAQLAQQPKVLTPPTEEAEGPAGGEGGEQDVAFREESAAAGAAETKEPTPKRVTFKEDELPPMEDEDEEEEGTVVGEQEDVFDFEPPSNTPQEPEADSPPSSPVLEAPLLRSTARSLERSIPDDVADKQPMYTLDGRSINPVSPSSMSPARSLGAVVDHTRLNEDLADEDNKVLVSMRRLTAADLPSHRASYRESLATGVKKWAMYGRLSSSRSPSGLSSDSEGAAYEGGRSLPIPLAFPPSSSPMSTTLEPLERKTSLSDREMLVPPLRSAMRSTSSSVLRSPEGSPSTTRRRPSAPSTSFAYSQSASLDPGPLLDDGDGSENSSGFVAPHLEALEGRRSGVAVGWASMVDR